LGILGKNRVRLGQFFTSFKMALILRTWPEYKKDLKELERDGD
tara:strand:+ start:113 stop:241 length:129 start_codon:yes stop_codon:yes gene_type:complete